MSTQPIQTNIYISGSGDESLAFWDSLTTINIMAQNTPVEPNKIVFDIDNNNFVINRIHTQNNLSIADGCVILYDNTQINHPSQYNSEAFKNAIEAETQLKQRTPHCWIVGEYELVQSENEPNMFIQPTVDTGLHNHTVKIFEEDNLSCIQKIINTIHGDLITSDMVMKYESLFWDD
jgi:hypothetical protein